MKRSRPCSPRSETELPARRRLGVRAEVRRHSRSRLCRRATASRSSAGTGSTRRSQFPEIADALTRASQAREAAVRRSTARSSRCATTRRRAFRSCRAACTSPIARPSRRIATTTPAALMVFDLLLDGKKTLVAEPWRVRRKHLAALLDHVDDAHAARSGSATSTTTAQRCSTKRARRLGRRHREARRRALRAGPALARRGSSSRSSSGRSSSSADGPSRATRASIFGALLLGYYDSDGRLDLRRPHRHRLHAQVAARHVSSGCKRLEQPKSPVHDDAARRTSRRTGRDRRSSSRSSSTNGRPTDICASRCSSAFATTRRRGRRSRTAIDARSAERGPVACARSATRRVARTTKPARRARQPSAVAPSAATARDDERRRASSTRSSRTTAARARSSCPTGTLEVSNLDKVFFPEIEADQGRCDALLRADVAVSAAGDAPIGRS